MVSNCPAHAAQSVKRIAGLPEGVGSIPTVVRQYFQWSLQWSLSSWNSTCFERSTWFPVANVHV